MYTLYCKEIHIFSLYNKYILKYYGVTNNFGIRKHLYSVNDKNKSLISEVNALGVNEEKSTAFIKKFMEAMQWQK